MKLSLVIFYLCTMSSMLRGVNCFYKGAFAHRSSLPTKIVGPRRLVGSRPPDDELREIQKKIMELTGVDDINLNSPKQVMEILDGKVKSTSRKSLLQAASAEVDPQRRLVMELVLKHKATASSSKRVHSSLATTTLGDLDDEDLEGSEENEDPEGSDDIEDSDDANSDSGDEWLSNELISPASHKAHVESLFGPKSKIDLYWKDPLLDLQKPSTRSLLMQIKSDICPMGFNKDALPSDPFRVVEKTLTAKSTGNRGTLLDFVREQKEKFPECILLVRVGDFYESHGVDALMLVEHCGLNAMAGKCRAGCPKANVQATLDGLTNEGFKVAVFEEAADTNSSPGPDPRRKLKNRMLGQVVSAASPTYLYNLVLPLNSDMLASVQESRPFVGVLSEYSGYTMVEISLEERLVKVSEQLTAEAVSCRLTAYPPVDPLFYVGDEESRAIPFLPSSSASRVRIKKIPRELVESETNGSSNVERAKRIFVRELIRITDTDEDSKLRESEFTLALSESRGSGEKVQTNPLYVETATQLGLMGDRAIPPLVSRLLPDSAPAACRRFLRRWLLTPPPPPVSLAMATVVGDLKERTQALPPNSVPSVGKVVNLLRHGQANAIVFREILLTLDSTLQLIDTYSQIDHMMTILKFESGIAADPDSIKARCREASKMIEGVISPLHHVQKITGWRDRVSDTRNVIPVDFLHTNEKEWRGRVNPEVCKDAYKRVEKTAAKLSEAIRTDFIGSDLKVDSVKKNPVLHFKLDNMLAIKEIPESGSPNDYFNPKDRNGKIMKARYTTDAVESALSAYVSACDNACRAVAKTLTGLSEKLCDEGHLPAIVQAAHFNLIMVTASEHASKANALGWALAKVVETGDSACEIHGLWPYWMDQSSAVSNDIELSGFFLLTAPNMSGKSTIMRSTAAAALLSVCGLCAPLSSASVIKRFDNLFVRSASSDIPSENLSAFGAELRDLHAILSCFTSDTLVFVDELGRGTSPSEGTSIAAAILEHMAVKGSSGMFATHLHDIFRLSLRGIERISNKQIVVSETMDGEISSSYRIEDGMCTDSLAMETAARFGFPKAILERANEFSFILSEKPTGNTSSANEGMSKRKGSFRSVARFSLKDVERVIRKMPVIQKIKGFEESVVWIEPSWKSPPSMEGRCCIYILELYHDDETLFYVGETDSLSRRLAEHRKKGGSWSDATAISFPIPAGKTKARLIEALVIRELSKVGFAMESVSDGRKMRPDSK